MKELTDLKICKRITEIEGLTSVESASMFAESHRINIVVHGQGRTLLYDPLNDDSLNKVLRDKYCVEITYDGYCMIFNETHDFPIVELAWDSVADINRAVLLAIIEANNEAIS